MKFAASDLDGIQPGVEADHRVMPVASSENDGVRVPIAGRVETVEVAIGRDQVIARAAGDCVAALAAFQRVVASRANQQVVAPAGVPVDADRAPDTGAAAVHGVGALMGPALLEALKAQRGHARAIADRGRPREVAPLTGSGDGDVPAGDVIRAVEIAVLDPDVDKVAPLAAIDRVIARVVPVRVTDPPADVFVAGAAIDQIVAGRGIDEVVPGPGADDVVAGAAVDHVLIGRAGNVVVARARENADALPSVPARRMGSADRVGPGRGIDPLDAGHVQPVSQQRGIAVVPSVKADKDALIAADAQHVAGGHTDRQVIWLIRITVEAIRAALDDGASAGPVKQVISVQAVDHGAGGDVNHVIFVRGHRPLHMKSPARGGAVWRQMLCGGSEFSGCCSDGEHARALHFGYGNCGLAGAFAASISDRLALRDKSSRNRLKAIHRGQTRGIEPHAHQFSGGVGDVGFAIGDGGGVDVDVHISVFLLMSR